MKKVMSVFKAACDWELDTFKDFFNILYSMRMRAGGIDKLQWIPFKKRKLIVYSF